MKLIYKFDSANVVVDALSRAATGSEGVGGKKESDVHCIESIAPRATLTINAKVQLELRN